MAQTWRLSAASDREILVIDAETGEAKLTVQRRVDAPYPVYAGECRKVYADRGGLWVTFDVPALTPHTLIEALALVNAETHADASLLLTAELLRELSQAGWGRTPLAVWSCLGPEAAQAATLQPGPDPAMPVTVTGVLDPTGKHQRRAEQAEAEKRTLGRFRRYEVRRLDGRDQVGCKHAGCDLFVLDLTHDPYARFAADAYAMACRGEYPKLAEDLDRVVKGEPRPQVPDLPFREGQFVHVNHWPNAVHRIDSVGPDKLWFKAENGDYYWAFQDQCELVATQRNLGVAATPPRPVEVGTPLDPVLILGGWKAPANRFEWLAMELGWLKAYRQRFPELGW